MTIYNRRRTIQLFCCCRCCCCRCLFIINQTTITIERNIFMHYLIKRPACSRVKKYHTSVLRGNGIQQFAHFPPSFCTRQSFRSALTDCGSRLSQHKLITRKTTKHNYEHRFSIWTLSGNRLHREIMPAPPPPSPRKIWSNIFLYAANHHIRSHNMQV